MVSNHPNIIKLEAKSADQLELMIGEIDKAFTPIAIYGMNSRHYAWLSFHTGVKKRIVKSKTKISESKKVNTKI
jgi:hypothetical protein